MNRPLTIALDAMGGKYAPHSVLQGAERAIRKSYIPEGSKIILFGDQEKITLEISKCPHLQKCVEVRHTAEFVSDTDKPGMILRKGDNTSMGMAVRSVKEGEADCIVSSGNTGALMVLGRKHLRMIEGIERPAIASPMPTSEGGRTIVLDLGATIEANENTYLQLALMGGVFARYVLEMEHPKIGIVNVGEEAQKGGTVIRAASDLISQTHLPGEYIGFIEGNDIAKGTVDVAVTDGFTGNVLLKATEGTASLIKNMFRMQAEKENILNKIRLLIAKPVLSRINKAMDPRRYNGAMFLGLDGVCVKSHGSMDDIGFANAIKVAAEMATHQFNKKVAIELAKIMEEINRLDAEKQVAGQ